MRSPASAPSTSRAAALSAAIAPLPVGDEDRVRAGGRSGASVIRAPPAAGAGASKPRTEPAIGDVERLGATRHRDRAGARRREPTTSAGRPWASLPSTIAVGHGEVELRRRARRPGRRWRSSHPCRSQLVEHGPRVSSVSYRKVEQGARRGPHALRVARVDGVPAEQYRRGARRLGGAQQGAGVARIGHVDEDQVERALGRRRDRSARVDLGTRGDGGDRLRRDGVDGLAQHLGLDVVDLDPGRRGTGRGARRVAPGAANTSSTSSPAVERLGEQRRAVDDERALLRTRSAAPREAPQPLHAWMARPEGPAIAQAFSLADAAVAWATSAAKASGSCTARSARTLRSTSISATPQAGDEPAVGGAVLSGTPR